MAQHRSSGRNSKRESCNPIVVRQIALKCFVWAATVSPCDASNPVPSRRWILNRPATTPLADATYCVLALELMIMSCTDNVHVATIKTQSPGNVVHKLIYHTLGFEKILMLIEYVALITVSSFTVQVSSPQFCTNRLVTILPETSASWASCRITTNRADFVSLRAWHEGLSGKKGGHG